MQGQRDRARTITYAFIFQLAKKYLLYKIRVAECYENSPIHFLFFYVTSGKYCSTSSFNCRYLLVYLMFIGPCIIAIVDEWKTNLMSLAILFHLLCAQHVSHIHISIFRSLRLCWWITTLVVLFSVRCVLELLVRLLFGGVRFAGWSTTCWAHNKWNKTASDIKLVFHSSAIFLFNSFSCFW